MLVLKILIDGAVLKIFDTSVAYLRDVHNTLVTTIPIEIASTNVNIEEIN